MERNVAGTEHYFNSREGLSTRLDHALEWFEELGANLMEPSTVRSTENIAELRGQRIATQHHMGETASLLSRFGDTKTTDVTTELDAMITNSELVEVN